MSHHIDDRDWPLLQLRQSGPCSADDVRALTDALTAAVRRAATEARTFVVVLDYRQRETATTGGGRAAEHFWRGEGAAVARWCSAMIRLDSDDTVTVARQYDIGSGSDSAQGDGFPAGGGAARLTHLSTS